MILLDTCALLWLAHDQSRLSREVIEQIDDASIVYISAITGFEVGIKYSGGKLHLPIPPEAWMEQIISHHDLSVINLDVSICLQATSLPPIHRDPCDRFIIATALRHRLPVVTGDTRFQEYGIKVML